VHFHALYRNVRLFLQSTYPMEGEKEFGEPELKNFSSPISNWCALPLPNDFNCGSTYNDEHMDETVECLKSMCESTCFDVKMNGISSLAELACQKEGQKFVNEGCQQLLLACLPLNHLSLQHTALTALANISAVSNSLCNKINNDSNLMECIMSNNNNGNRSKNLISSSSRERSRIFSNCSNSVHSDSGMINNGIDGSRVDVSSREGLGERQWGVENSTRTAMTAAM